MLARLTYVGGGRAVVCAQMASASSWGKGKKAPDFNEYLREQNGGRLPGDKRAFVDLVERIMMTDNPWEKSMFYAANSGKVRLRPDRARWNNVPIAITSWSLEESVTNCRDDALVKEWGIEDTKKGAVRYFALLLYDLPTTQASLLTDGGGLHLLSSAAAAGAAVDEAADEAADGAADEAEAADEAADGAADGAAGAEVAEEANHAVRAMHA